MKAPPDDMPRDLDAKIVAEAVKLIETLCAKSGRILPPDSVEAFRAQLSTCIDIARRCYHQDANLPLPGEMKALAITYLNALKRAKRVAGAVRSFSRSDDFVAALDREIHRVHMEARDCLVVKAGARPRDSVADLAAMMARNLIDPDPYRHPENRDKILPAIDCPWRQSAMLTYGGAWLRLAALIYKGAIGKDAPDMMKYCREVDDLKPRYVVRLSFRGPS
jgi:hypothetical protein